VWNWETDWLHWLVLIDWLIYSLIAVCCSDAIKLEADSVALSDADEGKIITNFIHEDDQVNDHGWPVCVICTILSIIFHVILVQQIATLLFFLHLFKKDMIFWRISTDLHRLDVLSVIQPTVPISEGNSKLQCPLPENHRLALPFLYPLSPQRRDITLHEPFRCLACRIFPAEEINNNPQSAG